MPPPRTLPIGCARRMRAASAALGLAIPLAATAAAAQVVAQPGDVLVTSLTTGLVYRLDPSAPAPVAPVALTTGAPFSRPRGLAVDRNGLLLVTDDGPKTLVRANPALNERGLAAQFSPLTSALRGVVTASDGRVFIADPGLVPAVEPPLPAVRGITYFPLVSAIELVGGVTQGDAVAGCITLFTGVASCGNLYLPGGIAIESEAPELVLLVADTGKTSSTPPLRERQGVIRVFPDRPFSPPPISDPDDPPYPAVSGEFGDPPVSYFVNDELFCANFPPDTLPFQTPRSLAIDRSPGHEGSVLVTDSGYGSGPQIVPARVYRVAPSGCNDPGDPPVEKVAEGNGLLRPIGIAVADDGTIFVADATADAVFRIDPDTDPQDPDGDGTGTVSLLSTPGSIDQAWDLRIQRSHPGPYFVADASVPEILAVDPATPARATVTAGGALATPAALEVLPDAAGLLVADPAARAVIESALAGAQTVASQDGRLTAPTSASRESGGSYLVTDLGDPGAVPPIPPAVIRVDPTLASPGNQTLVSEGGLLVRPIAGAIDASGFLIVADAGDGTPDEPPRILRISPAEGLGDAGQVQLYPPPDASSLPLVSPVALALEEGGSSVLVADRGDETNLPAVLRMVRSATPPGTIATVLGLGSGDLLETPAGIAVDTDGSILVTDQGAASTADDGSVIRIDALSALQSQVPIGAPTDTLDLPTGIGVRPPGAGSFADQDGDRIADLEDNCISVANTDQRDTDDDGIGNICDPDFDGNGQVANPDFIAIRQAFGAMQGDAAYDEDLDMDGDLAIGDFEFEAILRCFGAAPGASGPLLIEPAPPWCYPPAPAP